MGRRAGVIACAIWILCGAYASRFVTRGWIPHDEGTIGQSAERVLRGELPHRDFDELYTGGVSYMHAGAMQAFGINLVTPRLVLFAFFMAFLAAIFAVARRVSPLSIAMAAMPFATVWSVPNYFVSLPSWYTLFFATFGVLALFRFLESPRRGWLVAAGVCGGLSLLAKITGAYYLVGTFLFLLYLEQSRGPARALALSRRSWLLAIGAAPVAFIAFLLSREPSLSEAVTFAPLVAPAFIVCGFVVWSEWVLASPGPSLERLRRVLDLVLPVAIGVLLVTAPFAVWYWRHDALSQLVQGVLVQPQRRLAEASITPPSLVMLAIGAPYAALLLIDESWLKARDTVLAMLVAVALGAVLFFGQQPLAFGATWTFIRALPMIVAIIGVLGLSKAARHGRLPGAQRLRVFLLVAMAGLLSLVQFPYASPTYFYYCAPVVALALLAVVSMQRHPLVRVHAIVGVFLCAFALLYTNTTYGWNLGVRYIPYAPSASLALQRGGLVVPDDDARTYEDVVRVLRQHATGGTIYAAPDCPEVYFLSGFPNPSRTIFEFLSLEPHDEAWTENLLWRAPVRAVVINNEPLVSPRLDQAVVSVLETRFPQSERVGRFTVRW